MQCPTCFSRYPDKIANCPRCRRPLAAQVAEEVAPAVAVPVREKSPVAVAPKRIAVRAANREARVLEFPARAQPDRPQWRQEVSARLREYQSRRGRILDGMAEPEIETPVAETVTPEAPLPGVVSLSHRKELAPVVVRALQRLERARQTMPSPLTSPHGLAAVQTAPESEMALAPVADPEPEPVSGLAHGLKLPVTITTPLPEPKQVTAPARVRRVVAEPDAEELPEPRSSQPPAKLVAVMPVVAEKETPPAVQPEARNEKSPRLVCATVIDDDYVEALEIEKKRALRGRKKRLAALEETEEDSAAWQLRVRAALIDWGVTVAASLPLLLWAVLSTSNWRWGNLFTLFLVQASLFMVLYTTALTFYAGRTWGHELLFLCVANVEDGGPPTLRQCALRAVVYLLWPLTLGLGLLYGLIDPEGRTLHDKVSGTIVLRS